MFCGFLSDSIQKTALSEYNWDPWCHVILQRITARSKLVICTVLHTDYIMQCYGQNKTAKLGVFTNYFLSLLRLLSDLSSAELNKRFLLVPVTQSMENSPSCLFHMSKAAQLHTSQKFEHLLQDATKIFSLTEPCHQQSMLHKQSTSKISCILPQNTERKQETF